ncbi:MULTISPECIES: PLP-dependent aminotransferase family protein [Streptomyces]|uniref:PLP-dependent aminotransferase family protein n=1 Tax=Streptomyces evansiae TaxID=3075535 RepID=A0ABU2R735_9ACTN|nr:MULTISPECIES: PLP-dependent aminotransferase family protein [unclassified Streptomyces]MDT0412502.1 PLP-dependent aminotransferase family protein [Streptomyces sp. DSM 41979]MYQ60384.1 aminotransferase class I/II-fold pyridoxal phosphate-dependent enzyme [Streptomyces sp. SID4926]SCE32254.1 (S)-3,5-dihydroxyphenylglycine transaminase [Streptomyces sp. DfronAA-171]
MPADDNLDALLDLDTLHASLRHANVESMTFLNEVAQLFPDAVSFAAGRPCERYLSVEAVHRYIDLYRDHLAKELDGDLAKVHRTMLQYGRTKGIIDDLVAEHLAVDEAIHVDRESVVVTVGCQEALFLTLRALRRTERDVVLTVRPAYVGITGAALLTDMRLLSVADSPGGLDFDDLERVLREAREEGLRPRALYIVADFANPSGATLDLPSRYRLLELAEAYDFLVLEDNPYGFFTGDDEDGLPTLKSLDRSQRVVYLGSFGKTGVPGARVGYVVADQRIAVAEDQTELLADQLARLKSMLTVNTSPIGQAVIGGRLLEHNLSLRAATLRERQIYRENRRQVTEGLARRFPPGKGPEVTWNSPRGGFFLVLDVPFPVTDELLEHAGREHKVLFTPMHHFYGDGVPVPRMRLSASQLTADEIETGLDALARFIHEQVD